MSEDTRTVLATLAGISLLVLFALGISMCAGWATCRSGAHGLGLEYSWRPFQGCLVTRRDGIIVPISNYGRADRD